MNRVSAIARILLGILFLTFGLNGFLNFIPTGPMPGGLAGQFSAALFGSYYMKAVATIEVLASLLLLLNRYVPLGLTLLAPVIVNIVFFHVFLMPTGAQLAAIAVLLWLLAAYRVRSSFASLLEQQA